MKTFRAQWVDHVKERLEAKDGFPGIVKMHADRGGRFSTWHLLASPESSSDMELDKVIHIGCVFPTDKHYLTFLSWANESADRALADERFTVDPEEERLKGHPRGRAFRGWRIEGVYPGNHGMTLVNACFAHALRDDSELDQATLLLATQEITQTCLHGGARTWDYIAQSDYLRCVRLALVAGRVDQALLILKNNRRKFKHTFLHQEWLRTLCNAIDAAHDDALAPEAVAHFQAFFDVVRDPQAKLPRDQTDGSSMGGNLSNLRLELAVIKQRYILKQPLAGQWPNILALISE
jgi:hypothetical protein